MSKYIPFTTEQKERAASVDLEEFLRRRGEKLITSGRDKRLASDHSITIRGCEWFDHATEQGGRAISFVKQFYGLSYPDAMSLLLGDDRGGSYPAAKEKVPESVKPFTLPPQSESMRRVYAYPAAFQCWTLSPPDAGTHYPVTGAVGKELWQRRCIHSDG